MDDNEKDGYGEENIVTIVFIIGIIIIWYFKN